jgi:gamma-glutamylcyclotransferase (GGCT)/AIG2-like uncharacterized protein YtfP
MEPSQSTCPNGNELSENVFVYGSLREGQKNHYVLQMFPTFFLSKSQIKGEVKPTVHGFPCLLEGLGLVEGEVWATTKEGLQNLDRFEMHPYFYERRRARLISPSSGEETVMRVWAYYGTGVLQDMEEPIEENAEGC